MQFLFCRMLPQSFYHFFWTAESSVISFFQSRQLMYLALCFSFRMNFSLHFKTNPRHRDQNIFIYPKCFESFSQLTNMIA